MKIFEPHIQMLSRTTGGYEAMVLSEVQGICESTSWPRQLRTTVRSFTVQVMRKVGTDEEEVEKTVLRNPIEFFIQSGQNQLC